jgi:starch synthase (maltosyl-transferring)
VRFLETGNEQLLAYVKHEPGNTLVILANLDPHNPQEGAADMPYDLGLPPVFAVQDLLSGEHYDWHLGANFVRLWPNGRQVQVLRVEP